MAIYGLCIVRDEDDVIRQSLIYALNHCERVFVLDNDSSDETWRIVEDVARRHPRVAALGQIREPFRNGLRSVIYNEFHRRLADDDWWLMLDADEFLAESPWPAIEQANREGANLIETWQAQFYYTDVDLAARRTDRVDRPIFERRRYYCIDWHEPRFFRNRTGGHWDPARSERFPDGIRKVCSRRVLNRHYQFRDPPQIEKRIALRYRNNAFAHVRSRYWRDYVRAASRTHHRRDDEPWDYSNVSGNDAGAWAPTHPVETARPLVSVIIAAYNARPWLRASVESILGQSYDNLEIFVVDDGSTDGTLRAVEDIRDRRLHLRRQERANKSTALNRALEEVRGEFFAIQDADDLSHTERMEQQVNCLLANDDVAAVFCGHELLLGRRRVGPRLRFQNREACRRAVERLRMPAHDPTAMFRRSLVDHLRFDPELPMAQGYDYVLRVGERHPMLVLERCLYTYRVRDESRTRIDSTRRSEVVRRVQEHACARRRLSIQETRAVLDEQSRAPGAHSRDNNLPAHFMESVLDLRRNGRSVEARQAALACVRLQPMALRYYQPLMYAVLPTALVAKLRRWV
jgi:glycosyltransferase involved in cell wall biosynthesis